jgi:hypothetical protein
VAGWPVYWDITAVPTPGPENALRQLQAWVGWVERRPGIGVVLPNGLNTQVFAADGRVRQPDWLIGPMVKHNVLVEWSLPIRWGGQRNYPFPEARQVLDEHLERLGPTRLAWGSEVPNVERFCTYRQTIIHLTEHWPGVSPDDLRMVMGGNIAHLFGLDAEAGV